jgi:hypothetical protein
MADIVTTTTLTEVHQTNDNCRIAADREPIQGIGADREPIQGTGGFRKNNDDITDKNVTSQEQQREVIFRCMHMFLRSYGRWVALESFEVFVSACNMILTSWNETKRYSLALDIATVLADVTILQRPSEGRRILHYIHTVAEYLEANGNMKDAAHMYLGLDEFCAKDWPELQCLSNAGLAFKYSGDHSMAESVYVRAFHILYTFGITIHNPEHDAIVANVYYLYRAFEGKRKGGGGGLAINNDQESLVVIYGDLLKAAKYKSTDKRFNAEIEQWGNPLNLKCELQNADCCPERLGIGTRQ